MNHYADNEETIKAGLEYALADVAALRRGTTSIRKKWGFLSEPG